MSITTLIHIERPNYADCHNLLHHSVHADREEAIDALFEYVAGNSDTTGRIQERYESEFIDYVGSEDSPLSTADLIASNGELLPEKDWQKRFKTLSHLDKEEICEWYFDMAADDLVEAFFTIETTSLKTEEGRAGN